jgi:hypothetical protein
MAARLLQVVVFPYRGCSFTAVTRVQIPSGTPSLINELPGFHQKLAVQRRYNLVLALSCRPLFLGRSNRASNQPKILTSLGLYKPQVAVGEHRLNRGSPAQVYSGELQE